MLANKYGMDKDAVKLMLSLASNTDAETQLTVRYSWRPQLRIPDCANLLSSDLCAISRLGPGHFTAETKLVKGTAWNWQRAWP
jgi:hypothetical protein